MRYLHIMMYIQTYYAKDTSKNSPVSLAGFHSWKHSCSATIMPWKMQMVALCIELPKLPQTKGRSSKARVRTVTTGPVWHRPFRRGECLHYEPSLWALVIDIIDSDKNPFQFLWIEGSVWFYREWEGKNIWHFAGLGVEQQVEQEEGLGREAITWVCCPASPSQCCMTPGMLLKGLSLSLVVMPG